VRDGKDGKDEQAYDDGGKKNGEHTARGLGSEAREEIFDGGVEAVAERRSEPGGGEEVGCDPQGFEQGCAPRFRQR